ncbi:carbohydrate-binding protein [Cytobacillus sp. IB215665]|uniref:carbohydrate-binding protein n=1 Tax=Cytobacillus sp. IB215665 TaxID=3097357 RepID=UPI002A15BBAF|nr:carbohydrate-binding protein [Cytobacillus sp. IB215665]MDX8364640.1 carbohydrate-binding protein [Cytobacillus sp. IB215665]
MLKKTFLVMIMLTLILPMFSGNIAAAINYQHAVNSLTETKSQISFTSNVNTSWVDVHYKVNTGVQQNVRMNKEGSTFTHELSGLEAGDIIDYSFTYNNGTPAYNTPWYESPHGLEVRPEPESEPEPEPEPTPVPEPNTDVERLVIDDFNRWEQWNSNKNDLNESIIRNGGVYNLEGNRNLYFFFNGGSRAESFDQYINRDISAYDTLELTLKSPSVVEENSINIVLNDGTNHSLKLSDYGNITSNYQTISIPLVDFQAELTNAIFLRYEGIGTGKIVRIDEMVLTSSTGVMPEPEPTEPTEPTEPPTEPTPEPVPEPEPSNLNTINPFEKIEAENYDFMRGIDTEVTTDVGSGQNVGWTDNGDYIAFENVDFGTETPKGIEARVASQSIGGTIEVRLDGVDGPLLGTVDIQHTGGWQNWVTNTSTISNVTGTHDVYLVFKGVASGIGNLNWFVFTSTTGQVESVEEEPDEQPENSAGDDNQNPSQSDRYEIQEIGVGDSLAQVLEILGPPQREDVSKYGFTWYIYNQSYENFIMVGVENSKVVALFTNATNWTTPSHLKYGDNKTNVDEIYGEPLEYYLKGNTRFWINESPNEVATYSVEELYITFFYDIYEQQEVAGILYINKDTEDQFRSYYGNPSTNLTEVYAKQIFDLANVERVKRDLKPFIYDETVSKAAFNHSKDMALRNFFDHTDPDGKNVVDRLRNEGILSFSLIAENIAAGQYNAIYANAGWMNSSGHRANILGNAERLGTGVYYNPDSQYRIYYTQNFYTPR